MESERRSQQFDVYGPLFGSWTKVAEYRDGQLSSFETIYCVILSNMGVLGVRSEEDVGKLDSVSQLLLHPPHFPLHDISHVSAGNQRGTDYAHHVNMRVGTAKSYKTLRFCFETEELVPKFVMAMDIMEAARLHIERAKKLNTTPVFQWLHCLYNKQFDKVIFVDENISAKQFQCLADSAVSGLSPHFMKMESIHISGVNLLDEKIKFLLNWLAQNPSVTSISLKGCNLSKENTALLAAGLAKLQLQLNDINLSDNVLGNGVADIAQFVSLTPYVESLNLSKNNLNDSSVDAILHILAAGRLQRLDISNNHIGDDGAKLLSNAVGRCHCLKSLHIRKCGMTTEGVNSILYAISENRHSVLTDMDITGNEIDYPAVANVVRQLRGKCSLNSVTFGGKTVGINTIRRSLRGMKFQKSNIVVGKMVIARNLRIIGTLDKPARLILRLQTAVSCFNVRFFLYQFSKIVQKSAQHFEVMEQESVGDRHIVLTLDIINVATIPRLAFTLEDTVEDAPKEESNPNEAFRDRLIDAVTIPKSETYDTEDAERIRKELDILGLYAIEKGEASDIDHENNLAMASAVDQNHIDAARSAWFGNVHSPLRASKRKALERKNESLSPGGSEIGESEKTVGVDAPAGNSSNDEIPAVSKEPGEGGDDNPTTGEQSHKEVANDAQQEVADDTQQEAGDPTEQEDVEDADEEDIGSEADNDEQKAVPKDLVFKIAIENLRPDRTTGKVGEEKKRNVTQVSFEMARLVGVEEILRKARQTTVEKDPDKAKEMSSYLDPPEFLPQTIQRGRLVDFILNRNKDSVEKILHDSAKEEGNTPKLAEVDEKAARRFVRQYNSIKNNLNGVLDSKSSHQLAVEIANAAKFGLKEADLDTALEYYRKTENFHTMDAAFTAFRILIQAMGSRNLAQIRTAISNASTVDNPGVQILINAADELIKKIETALSLLEDAVLLCSLNKGNIKMLESAMTYSAQVGISSSESLWASILDARKSEAKTFSVEYCIQLAIDCASFSKFEKYINYASMRAISTNFIFHAKNLRGLVRQLMRTLETSAALKALSEQIDNDKLDDDEITAGYVRDTLDDANEMPVFTSGRFKPFEKLVKWYNKRYTKVIDLINTDVIAENGTVVTDEETVEKEESKEHSVIIDPAGIPGQTVEEPLGSVYATLDEKEIKIPFGKNEIEKRFKISSIDKMLSDLENATTNVDLPAFASTVRDCHENTAIENDRGAYRRFINLQLRMACYCEGPTSRLFDEALLLSVSSRTHGRKIKLAAVLSALEEMRRGQGDGMLISCDSDLSGPNRRSHERFLMQADIDSTLKLELWPNMRSIYSFRKGYGTRRLVATDFNQSMMSHTSMGIPNSLTKLGDWESNEAISLFYSLQHCMRKSKLNSSYYASVRSLASRLLLSSQKLSEEMYLQLTKQLNLNKNVHELKRGWDIMAVYLRTRQPVKALFTRLKLFVFRQASLLYQYNSVEAHACYRVARYCALYLTSYNYYSAQTAPSDRLYEYALSDPRTIIIVFPDGLQRDFLISPYTPTSQFLEDLCAELNHNVGEWKEFSLAIDELSDFNHIKKKVGGRVLGDNEDILWACGGHFVTNKHTVPFDFSDTPLRLKLIPKSPLRRLRRHLSKNAASLQVDKFMLYYSLGELSDGKHRETMDVFAFLALLLLRIQKPDLLIRDSRSNATPDMVESLSQIVPMEIYRGPGVVSTLLRVMKTLDQDIKTNNPDICTQAFLGFAKCLPFYGSKIYDNVSFEIQKYSDRFSCHAMVAINGNGIAILSKGERALLYKISFLDISGWRLIETYSKSGSAIVITLRAIDVKFVAKLETCHRICESMSHFCQSLLRNEVAEDISSSAAFELWTNEYGEHLFPGRPQIMPMNVDKRYENISRRFICSEHDVF